MTSTFAAQLGEIAATSTNELDLRAQKVAHSQSLIFEPKVAGSQDFETVYQLCLEGYQDLCALDPRFREYERNIFHTQSKGQDRAQMTAQENEALDDVLEQFLALVGGRLLLRPAIKAVEWLVRRFKIHIYNSAVLLSTFLPYHETPLFRNLLSIMSNGLPVEYKFLGPYLKTATNPPRHAIAYSMINSDQFFRTLNNYTLHTCKHGAAYSSLLSFWTSITVEAVAGRLALAQSGRNEEQRQRQEDILLQVVPLLKDGLAMREVPEMVTACYTIVLTLADKLDLTENVLDSFMEAIALSLANKELESGIICLSVLAENKSNATSSKRLVDILVQIPNIPGALRIVSTNYSVDKLSQGLVRAALQSLKKKNYAVRVQFIENLMRLKGLRTQTLELLCRDVVTTILQLHGRDAVSDTIRVCLSDMLRRLYESTALLSAVRRAAAVLDKDGIDLESILGHVMSESSPSAPETDQTLELDAAFEKSTTAEVETVLKHVPERTVNEHSFLTLVDSPLFRLLSEAFQACCKHQGGASQFQALNLWKSVSQVEAPLYISFLLRITCGSYSTVCRSTALRLIAHKLEAQSSNFDAQALLPYITTTLSDADLRVRRAASDVLLAMRKVISVDLIKSEECHKWGFDELYDTEMTRTIHWMPSSDFCKILDSVFLPSLEECVSDATQISQTLRAALNGNSSHARTSGSLSTVEMKKGLRHSLFQLMTTHLIATPLLSVKVNLISELLGVEKVGSTTKTKTLLPVLRHWSSLSPDEAVSYAAREHLKVSDLDSAMTAIVTSTEKDATSILLSLLNDGKGAVRPDMVGAIFARITDLWQELNPEGQTAAAQKLTELSHGSSAVSSARARDVLLSVRLPTEALSHILGAAFSGVQEPTNLSPARKRRRTSSGHKPLSSGVDNIVSQITLALELVDSSQPESHPQLLNQLFHALAVLQKLKSQTRREFAYLLNLCLSSALAILRTAGSSPQLSKDLSLMRTELVTECVRTSGSPQVQNTALLLTAELARLAPEKVLHNVMPIFTFMGSHTLTKDDEYSAYVVNQTIDQVIPPMIKSLKDQRKDIVEGSYNLLSSFTAGFEHIPRHRRLALFERLVRKLGPGNVLHVIIAMLVVKHPDNAEANRFSLTLMSTFSAETQLHAITEMLSQVSELLLENPNMVKTMLGTGGIASVANTAAAQIILSTLGQLFASSSLKREIGKMPSLGPSSSASLDMEMVKILRQLLQLARNNAIGSEPGLRVHECTLALLTLLPLPELVKLISEILKEHEASLRQEALKILHSQLLSAASKDAKSRDAALEFLSTLADLIGTEADDGVKLTAVACIDRISERYGRNRQTLIVNVANVLCGDNCFGSKNVALQPTVLLCLASMVDLLKEAIIPAVPVLISRALFALEVSMEADQEEDRLHNAAYSLLSALVSNVSFMISETQLDALLKLSAESANIDFGDECCEARTQTLALLARKIDMNYLAPSLQRTWNHTVENDVNAVQQALDVLGNSINHAAKSAVLRSMDQISDLLIQILDLRRIQFTRRDQDSYNVDEVKKIENAVNAIAINFIYKLNDTMFRPIFSRWVDWAIKCPGVHSGHLEKAKMLRCTTLFGFMTNFFATLKSIVTSYATYILQPATEVLQSIITIAQTNSAASDPLNVDQLNLWITTLTMLREACSHDQDSFFISPSHFSPLAETLVSQVLLATYNSLQASVHAHLPTAIIAFASATAEMASHHKDINHHICQLRHSDFAGVRLASIQIQQALTDSEDVGDEWVSNVVRQGGETMVYVNEMLEDDDEDVEREVRKWVRKVREMVGEDVFEM